MATVLMTLGTQTARNMKIHLLHHMHSRLLRLQPPSSTESPAQKVGKKSMKKLGTTLGHRRARPRACVCARVRARTRAPIRQTLEEVATAPSNTAELMHQLN